MDGEVVEGTENLTIGDERCSFRREQQQDILDTLDFIEVSGPCEVDLEELRVTFTVDDTKGHNWSWPIIGTTLTFAFAPADRPVFLESIDVSFFGSEQTFNQSTGMWELGNSEFSYGAYCFYNGQGRRLTGGSRSRVGLKWSVVGGNLNGSQTDGSGGLTAARRVRR